MRGKPLSILISLLILCVALQGAGPLLSAQATSPAPEELDQLLAPVALYPDALLSQITTASTNPQEILDVNAWLQANPGLTGAALTDAAEKQGFDPAFIALVNFPQVLDMMAQHIDDYAAVGQAFSADQESVTASIQRLRSQAYNSGALRTTEQQKVEVQQSTGQTIYVIQPANPTVVYVPQYDPTIVYVRPAPGAVVATPVIGFYAGIGIGALIVDNRPWGWGGWGWNWGARRAYYNHGYWNGWGNPYRPPYYSYRPRPIVWANRPGYRGNWGYRPPHYRAPNYPSPRPGRPANPPGGHHPTPGKPTLGSPTLPESPVVQFPESRRLVQESRASQGHRTSRTSRGQANRRHQAETSQRTRINPRFNLADRSSLVRTSLARTSLVRTNLVRISPIRTQPSRASRPAEADRRGRISRPGTGQPHQPGSSQPGSKQPDSKQPRSNQPKPAQPVGPGGKQQARPTQPSGRRDKPDTPDQPKSDQPKPNGRSAQGQGSTAQRGRFGRQQV